MNHYQNCLLDNSPTDKLEVSQDADWATRGLVDSPTKPFLIHEKTTLYFYTEP